MTTDITAPISKEEIEWVKAKHTGIQKAARRMLKEAIDLGQWFVEADERMGLKKSAKGGRGGTWHLWLRATFPEIGLSTIQQYMQLGSNRAFLEKKFGLLSNGELSIDRRNPATIKGALRAIKERDRETKGDTTPQLPLAEREEPLLILRDQLKEYVFQAFQLQYLETEIRFRIKNAKLGKRQIRQAIEWATQEHLEVRETVLKTFLGSGHK
jgi:hypothetical protein